MIKRNLTFAILTGLATGAIWTAIFIRLGTLNFLNFGSAIWALVPLVAIGYVLAIYVGEWLARLKSFLSSFVRFVLVGFLNTGIDLGIFNLLIYVTQIEKGAELSLFKGVAAGAAMINSYFFNKFWTFEAGKTIHQGVEFFKYIGVTIVGFVINVAVTYAIANHITPVLGFSQLSWDSIAAVVATVCSLIWNFVGYRLLVFKTK